jgi:hypothetical protein
MRSAPLLVLATAVAVGCSNDGNAPNTGGDGDGARLATQFEQLADSVDGGGYSPAAEALRHAAQIVRLTGHATPVTVTIDGGARGFSAVAEQIDFPNLVCSWPSDSGVVVPPDSGVPPPRDTVGVPPSDTISVPPPDSVGVPPIDSNGVMPPDTVPIPIDSGVVRPPEPPECRAQGTSSMRTLIAWEPEHMVEVVRIVAYIGSSGVEPGVPDVMTGLPSGTGQSSAPTSPPDSGSGSGGEPGGFPGFMGEYLVRDVGSWFAVEGNQANDLIGSNGECTAQRATFDWAEFECVAARFRFEFSMGVEPLRYEPLTGVADPPGGPEGNHTVSMSSSEVDGVRLTWKSWTPPPLPPDSIPMDSSRTGIPMSR